MLPSSDRLTVMPGMGDHGEKLSPHIPNHEKKPTAMPATITTSRNRARKLRAFDMVFVRLTIGAQPRAGFARVDFDRRRFRLVGCNALLAGDAADGSARTPLITILLFPNAPTISRCPPSAAR